jgi:proline iminopeptidase
MAEAMVRARNADLNRAAVPPEAIDQSGFVSLRGTPQWVSIRGRDRRAPVLLVLHGGPGAAFEPLTRQAWQSWTQHFTVAHWDQPGAGRTHGRHGASIGELSLERIVEDGLALAEMLCARLDAERVIVLGASWGSIVGVEMVRRRPDLFSAYVGAGQVVDMAMNESVGYEALADRLRDRGASRALERLQAIGPPPYRDLQALLAQRRILMAHPSVSERGLVARSLWRLLRGGLGPGAIRTWLDGQRYSAERLLEALMAYRDPQTPIPAPAIFIQGEEDIQTPTVLVEAFVQHLTAPSKALVTIPGGGHNALLFMPDRFLEALRAELGRAAF